MVSHISHLHVPMRWQPSMDFLASMSMMDSPRTILQFSNFINAIASMLSTSCSSPYPIFINFSQISIANAHFRTLWKMASKLGSLDWQKLSRHFKQGLCWKGTLYHNNVLAIISFITVSYCWKTLHYHLGIRQYHTIQFLIP